MIKRLIAKRDFGWFLLVGVLVDALLPSVSSVAAPERWKVQTLSLLALTAIVYDLYRLVRDLYFDPTRPHA